MDDELVFGSVETGRLIFASPKRGDDGEIWSVQVIVDVPGLRAETTVATHYASHFDEFVAYVDDLAEHWKGWSGAKTYASLEKDFSVSATNDGGAQVVLRVVLKSQAAPPQWQVDVRLTTDPGQQMVRAARDAGSLLAPHRVD